MKTLNSLGTKPWYRFLKILYALVLLATVVIIYSMYIPAYDSFLTNAVQPFIIVLAILEIFKRSIYYIYFGTVSPKRVEVATYVERIKETIKTLQNTKDFPDATARFLADVSRVAKIEIENFEKDNSRQDLDKLSKVANLVSESSKLHTLGTKGFSAMNAIKVRSLYYALELGMDIDLIKIEV